ncbi:flagellar protein FlhE [Nissabacter sp. SGAir0207]|uniref:flagellar protein FlhE n=1 Tax=Nissabacter sp. SGAir0207 TaxID=2126321 RepID=UPI0010CD1F67|nr:flagellar protein FlhE [Nissabacter sp. SGAir0207]QCR35774.1 flagellar protein FlhE [Nissabacter sp. SGAir0207]
MLRATLWLAGLLPGLCAAAGTWHAASEGVTLPLRNQSRSTPLLHPPAAAPIGSGLIVSVRWRYRLLSPPPAGLQAWLCTPQRCTAIEGQSGVTHALRGEPATQPLRLVFSVRGKGVLNPPVRVVGQEVGVNYW